MLFHIKIPHTNNLITKKKCLFYFVFLHLRTHREAGRKLFFMSHIPRLPRFITVRRLNTKKN